MTEKSVKILRNRAQCKTCSEIIESRFRHDYQTCTCGAIAVDGGHDYLKRGGLPDQLVELSESEYEGES